MSIGWRVVDHDDERSNEERNGVEGRGKRHFELLNWICGYEVELKE